MSKNFEHDPGEGRYRTEQKILRLTKTEKKTYEDHVKELGVNFSAWVRRAIYFQYKYDDIVNLRLEMALDKILVPLLEKLDLGQDSEDRLRKRETSEILLRAVTDRAILLRLKLGKRNYTELENEVRYELESHSFMFDEQIFSDCLGLLALGGFVEVDDAEEYS